MFRKKIQGDVLDDLFSFYVEVGGSSNPSFKRTKLVLGALKLLSVMVWKSVTHGTPLRD